MVVCESCNGQEGVLRGQFSWCPQNGGLTRGSTGRARAAALLANSGKQRLVHRQSERCIPYETRKPVHVWGCLVDHQQKKLWREFFRDPTRWWDNRVSKKSLGAPDFRHRKSQEVLWLNNLRKPAWVDAQLAALDIVGVERRQILGPPGASRPAGDDRHLIAERVRQFCMEGHVTEAVAALESLVVTGDGCVPKALIYTVLKKCAARRDLALGTRVQACTVKMGYQSDTFLGFHMLRMYACHGRLQEAMDVFENVGRPDAFTWSAIISANVRQGHDRQAMQLYHRMRRTGVKPDGHVFVAALQACARALDLKTGQQVHADVLASGVEPDLFVCSGLVDMYAKCGSLEDALDVFNGLKEKNVVVWNAMIGGYSQHGMGEKALGLYTAMQDEGMVAPDSVTFVCLLQACASVGPAALVEGKQLHAQIREAGYGAEAYVASSLVNMYAKCGSLEEAQRVFDTLGEKGVGTWNALMAGYSQHGMGQKALGLYCAMQEEGTAVANVVTFVCLLQACASVGCAALETGKQLHTQVRKGGHEADVFVASGLVNMYAKCGSLEDARRLFDGLGRKNVVTWTALIAGYSQEGLAQEALALYKAMQQEGMAVADCVTFVCLLQACAHVAALSLGRQLHGQIVEQGLEGDVGVAASLINMYGKCGSMADAQRVFDTSDPRDIVVWTSLIAGYSWRGESEVVFELVRRMREEGTWPDGITFLSVLTVCSHVGLVNEGWEYFEAMSRHYGITPTLDHYTCMVDLLGRAGQLDEALALVRGMPLVPNAAIWHTLLGACRKWRCMEVGLLAFSEAVKLDKKDSTAYVLMSNMYTGAQMWELAREMQARRKRIRAWKQPGQSWWTDEDERVHSFVVGDERLKA